MKNWTRQVFVILGLALGHPAFAQVVVIPPPRATPPPISILSVTPGDPGDPGDLGGPGGGDPGNMGGADGISAPAATTTYGADSKDLKDMKQTISYPTVNSDYFDISVTASGSHGDLGNDNDPGHFYFDRAQANLGFAYHFDTDWTLGTILSYAHVDSSYGNINASTTLDSYLPTLFVAYSHGGWFAAVSTTEGWDTFTEQRGTTTGTANGAASGFQYGGKINGGYLFNSGDWSFGPIVDFHAYHLNSAGFNEDGAAASDLHFDRENTLTMQTQLGGLVRYDTAIGDLRLQPYFSASWQHEYADANQSVTGNTASGAAFSTTSVFLDRDAALLDLGVRAQVCKTVGVYLGYEAVVGGNYLVNTAEGGVDFSF